MVDLTSITLHLQSQRRLRTRTRRILVPRMGPWLLETATAPLRPGSQWRQKLQTLAVRAKLQHKIRRCLYSSWLPCLRSLIREMRLDMVIAFPMMATRISSNVLLCFSQSIYPSEQGRRGGENHSLSVLRLHSQQKSSCTCCQERPNRNIGTFQ